MSKYKCLLLLLCLLNLTVTSLVYGQASEPTLRLESPSMPITLGVAQKSLYLPFLKEKRVGLVVNQTSVLKGQHIVDLFVAEGIDVKMIFAPEHGFRGEADAGAKISNSVDVETGIEIMSIYGNQKMPSAAAMSQLDVVVFDIQDVGARFYTYISSMHYMMEAAADSGKLFLVLDRPNPNGRFVDGPVRQPGFESFVGKHPIPVLHGLTVAELAHMIVGEQWLVSENKLRLVTIPLANYHHSSTYSLAVKPSPNLPNDQSIKLYPSLCFFEATAMSIGRGTDFPFQVLGHDTFSSADFSFTPRSIPGAASKPKYMGVALSGHDLRQSDVEGLDLSLLLEMHRLFKANGARFFTNPDFMDKLSGTDSLRLGIESGMDLAQLRASWAEDLKRYKLVRADYMLYPE